VYLFSGDSRYADDQYRSSVRDDWQQQQRHLLVTSERSNYAKTTVARNSSSSRQNCRPSEGIVSAAEQLLMLASAQMSSVPSGFADCRSNSQDSGLGKDSDSGSSSSNVQTANQPANVVPSTKIPARDYQIAEESQTPHHPSSQSSSLPPDQPVCTVLPMTNYGRKSSHLTAHQCDAASRYSDSQSAQHEANQYLNRCETFSGKSPPTHPEFSDLTCRNGKQYCGQRFPIAQDVAYYGTVVNPLYYGRSHQVDMPRIRQLSQCRSDMNEWRVRYTTAGVSSSNCGRVVDGVPAAGLITYSASVSEHRPTSTCSRMSMFDHASGQRAHGRLVPGEQQDELMYYGRHNTSMSCRSAVDSHPDDANIARYHAAQQRYRPYNISVDMRHGISTLPRGSSRNLFYQTSPRSLMQFRQTNELLYDSRISGIR